MFLISNKKMREERFANCNQLSIKLLLLVEMLLCEVGEFAFVIIKYPVGFQFLGRKKAHGIRFAYRGRGVMMLKNICHTVWYHYTYFLQRIHSLSLDKLPRASDIFRDLNMLSFSSSYLHHTHINKFPVPTSAFDTPATSRIPHQIRLSFHWRAIIFL